MTATPRALAALLLACSILPSAAAAQTTVLVAHSEPGDRAGGGVDTVVTAQSRVFTLEKNYRGGVSVLTGNYSEPGGWRMEFAPPKVTR
jgi:hypothetical protein